MSYLEPTGINFFRRPFVRPHDPGTFIPDALPSVWLNSDSGQAFIFVGEQNNAGVWSNITTVKAGDVSTISFTDGTDTATALMGVFRIGTTVNSGIMLILGSNSITISIADGGILTQKIADGAITRAKLAQDVINDINNAQANNSIRVNTANINDIVDTPEIQWLVNGTTGSAALNDGSISEARLDSAVQAKLNATGDRIDVNTSPATEINDSAEIQWQVNNETASASLSDGSITEEKLASAVRTLLNRQLEVNGNRVGSLIPGANVNIDVDTVTQEATISAVTPSNTQPLLFENEPVSVIDDGENIQMIRDNAGKLTVNTTPPVLQDGKIVSTLNPGANIEMVTTEGGHTTISSRGDNAVQVEFNETDFTPHAPPTSYTSTIEFPSAIISNTAPYSSIFNFDSEVYEGQFVTLDSDSINCQQESLLDVITLTVAEAAIVGYEIQQPSTFYAFVRDNSNVIVRVLNADGTGATRALVDVRRPTRDPNTNRITSVTTVATVNPSEDGNAIVGDVQAGDVLFVSAVWEYAEAIDYISIQQDVTLAAGDPVRLERAEISETQGIEDITFDSRQERDDVVDKSELLEIVSQDVAAGNEEVLEGFYTSSTAGINTATKFLVVDTTTDMNYAECLTVAIRTSLFKRFTTGDSTANIRLLHNVGGSVVSGRIQGGTTTVVESNLKWSLTSRRDAAVNDLGEGVLETLYQAETDITTETGTYFLEGHTSRNVIVFTAAATPSIDTDRLEAQITANSDKIRQLQEKTHDIHTVATQYEVTTDDVTATFLETTDTSRITDAQILGASYTSTIPAVPSSTNPNDRTGVLVMRVAENLNRNEYVLLLLDSTGNPASTGSHNGNEFKNQITETVSLYDYFALGTGANSFDLARIMPGQSIVIRKVVSQNEWAGRLADDTVETDDITDDNVTLEKLSQNVRDMLGGGGAGSKDVRTGSFTVTEGTPATPGSPAIPGSTTITPMTLFQHLTGGSSTGTKTFDGFSYALWSDVADNINFGWETIPSRSSTNIGTLMATRAFTTAEIAVLGWAGADARSFNTFRAAGTIQVANLTRDIDGGETFPDITMPQPILLEIWRPGQSTGTLTSATVVFQMRLEDAMFRNVEVQADDIFLTARWDGNNAFRSLIRLRNTTVEVIPETPEVPAAAAVAGDTVKTFETDTENFAAVTFDSMLQRDDVTEKATLFDRISVSLTEPENIPFLFLNRTDERFTMGASDEDTAAFVDNPVLSVRSSFIEAFRVSEASNGDITANIRVVEDNGGVETTISETTVWTLRGKVTGATNPAGDDLSDNVYYCVRIDHDVEDSDIYSLQGHTTKHEVLNPTAGTTPDIPDGSITERELDAELQRKVNRQVPNYMLPTILQDWANHLSEKEASDGTWRRVDPDPYAARITVERVAACLIDEDRSTFTGNYFEDLTSNPITVTVNNPQYYPTSRNRDNTLFPGRISFATGSTTMAGLNALFRAQVSDTAAPSWRQIILVTFRLENISSVPTESQDLLRLGDSSAHPLLTVIRDGDNARIRVETVATRNPGAETFYHNERLNNNSPLVYPSGGVAEQHFFRIPDDWQAQSTPGGEPLTDSVRLDFFAFRLSDNTTLGTPATITAFNIPDRDVEVPPVTFTVTLDFEGVTVTGGFSARYTIHSDGLHFIELSNTNSPSITTGYRFEVYIDRYQVTTSGQGSPASYNSQMIDTVSETSREISYVLSFASTDYSTDEDARLEMVFSDGTARNNINLLRGVGEDGLSFDTITVNDITLPANTSIPAFAVTNFVVYSQTPASGTEYIASHSELQNMYNHRYNWIGLFIAPERNIDQFDLSARFTYLNGDDPGGGGTTEFKNVTTSSFSITDGTQAVTTTPATYTTYQWYSAGDSRGATVPYTGSKTFGGVTYRASPDDYTSVSGTWATTATVSSTNISTLFDLRGGGLRLYRSTGWTNPNAVRDLNDFAMDVSGLQIANFTPNSTTFPPTSSSETQAVLVEIWRPTSANTVFILIFQMRLDDPKFVTLPAIETNDALIVAMDSAAPTTGTGSYPTLRFRTELTPAVETTAPEAGSVTKTTATTQERFDALTFDSEVERDSIVEKSRLLFYETRVVLDPIAIPFLFLDRTLETLSVTITDNNLNEFVDNPVFSIRESLFRAYEIGTNLNIRIIRTRAGTRTTIEDKPTFSPVGFVSGSTNLQGNLESESYFCTSITQDVQDGDVFEIEGHTQRYINYPTLTYNDQDVYRIIQGSGVEFSYDPVDRALTIGAQLGFNSFILRYSGGNFPSSLHFNFDEDSPTRNVVHQPFRVDLDNSSVLTSSFVEAGSALGSSGGYAAFKVAGRYEIRTNTDNVVIIIVASTSTHYKKNQHIG